MVARSLCWTVLGTRVLVPIGRVAFEPVPGVPAAGLAGAPGAGVAGASATPTGSTTGAGAIPNLPTAGTMPPSAAGAGSLMAGTGSVTQPAAAGKTAAGAGSAAPPSAAGMQASAGAGAPAGADGRIPCDVAKILFNRCRSCHGSPTNLCAPMSLVTWADLQKPAVSEPSRKVYELVAARVQDTMRPMPPALDGMVAAADKTLLVDWCKQGAPSLPSSAAECPK